ncbi:hemin uptake protein HemP [Pseudooceanicola sp. LIPI14-2-Ac024]|uniref:hemin uptake protein HemP n=1 Tax=Pseudooceanicola sp. LIPI14-2-Ac024 TaxID=3344875 RepID=UPI0035CEB6EB
MSAVTAPPPRVEIDLGPGYPAGARVPCYDAADLLAGGSAVQIVLDGQVYALTLTQNGRLILTK